MRNEEIQMPFYRVIMDVWPAMKVDLVSVQQSEEYWEKVLTKYEQLSEKHANTPAADFARDMCLAAVNALEGIYRIQTGYVESVFGGNNEQGRMQPRVPSSQDGDGSVI